jgi:hypothetical protein
MNARLIFSLACLCSIVGLTACSTPGRSYTSATVVETLETEILANGSKMFVYRLRWPEETVPSHIHVSGGRYRTSPYDRAGVNIDSQTHKRLQENAGLVAARYNYCREGFLELDRSLERFHLWLKGECKEDASEQDRENFGEKRILRIAEK